MDVRPINEDLLHGRIDAGGLFPHLEGLSLSPFEPWIPIEPGKRAGRPSIRGLRIAVRDVFEYLAAGMSQAEVLADFPELASRDIRAF